MDKGLGFGVIAFLLFCAGKFGELDFLYPVACIVFLISYIRTFWY